MRGVGLAGVLLVLVSAGCAAPSRPSSLYADIDTDRSAAPEERRPAAVAAPARPTPEALAPVVLGTEDARPTAKSVKPTAPSEAAPAATVEVDVKARTVRIPVRSSAKADVVEWLLSAGPKHAGMSVLVTDSSPRDVAAALAKIGLSAGVRPEAVGEDRVRLPKGMAVEVLIEVTLHGILSSPPKETTGQLITGANRLLSQKAGGAPLEGGSWVYVGPQIIRDGDAELRVTELSGSLITTNLRDSSALIYWVPAAEAPDSLLPFPVTFYGSSEAAGLSAPVYLVIRAAAAAEKAEPAPAAP